MNGMKLSQTVNASASLKGTHVRTIGIEDEVFVVDRATGSISDDGWVEQITSADLLRLSCESELYHGMLEMRTSVHANCANALSEFESNRRRVRAKLAPAGKQILACGTHPFARWEDARLERKERYQALLHGYGLPIARTLTCGMHVHFGFAPEVDLAVSLNNIRPYLPFIAAVSASSPFWQGRLTGLQSYRRAVYDALPRTGLPPIVSDVSQYKLLCDSFGDSRCLSDSTTVWWDARINLKHNTIEIRVSDSMPDVRTAQAVIVFALTCMDLAFSRERLQMLDACIEENRWSATRFGLDSMMYFGNHLSRCSLRECVTKLLATSQAEQIAAQSGWTSESLRSMLLAEDSSDLVALNLRSTASRFLEYMLRVSNNTLCI